jgi:hypothetical protein
VTEVASAVIIILVQKMVHSFTLKIQAKTADLSETLLHMYWSVRRHIQEDRDLDSFNTAYFIQGVINA